MTNPDKGANKTSAETESAPDLLGAIDAAIEAMRVQLTGGKQGAGTLTDLVKLLQLRKELDADRPRNITVRWIDGDE